ncbi:hypothetical protein OOT46_09015 [Aquabacterium sp. A7-Y]|uniref:hypothetical protein n=1 Tax=Aquabacterium sp. A7-Y TaxID=1349605 RepID=UPI00223DBAFC|nr:hypothetical protein [Aquabacterium sp. A7-Y]MCW7537988.1 hypothetical protein [Aquabacterium sp. A7-Y]
MAFATPSAPLRRPPRIDTPPKAPKPTSAPHHQPAAPQRRVGLDLERVGDVGSVAAKCVNSDCKVVSRTPSF